jgi:CheY-like chemotaxis protein
MHGNKSVIIADSDAGLLQVFVKVLKLEGFEVIPCTSGMEVIARAAAGAPSLVVCGYILPMLDGLKTCRYLKREPATTEVHFLMLTPG